MTAQDRALTKISIMRHEGFSPRPVPDTRGEVIGYGYNVVTGPPLTEPQAQRLLEDHIDAIEAALLKAWPPYASQDGLRQRCLVEMSYQVGVAGVLGFTKLLRALEEHDHERAALEVLDSELARNQTPNRARDYAALLRSEDPCAC